MPLDPENAAFVELANHALGRGPFDLAKLRGGGAAPGPAIAALPVRTEELRVPREEGEIPVRVYRPADAPAKGILVYFHGGGFVIGSIGSVDAACRYLTHKAQCLTISADYRLAPEHPFPAGVEDAFTVSQWAIARAEQLAGRGARVAVGGDSAGGTLAIVACLMARDRGAPIPAFQLLFYPGLNIKLETPERDALARAGYVLTRELIDWLNPLYCEREADYRDPYCAPAYAQDLSGLPPALMVAGQYDPLREENALFASRLAEAGIATTYSEYEGAVHGFATAFEIIRKGRYALAEGAAALRGAFT